MSCLDELKSYSIGRAKASDSPYWERQGGEFRKGQFSAALVLYSREFWPL